MDCSEQDNAGSWPAFKKYEKKAVGSAGVFKAVVFGFLGKSPRGKPIKQFQIHPQAAKRELRRMGVKIDKAGDYQAV
jgi:hypothetical protein